MNRQQRRRENPARLTLEDPNAIVPRLVADPLSSSARKLHLAAVSTGIATFRPNEPATAMELALGATRAPAAQSGIAHLGLTSLPVN